MSNTRTARQNGFVRFLRNNLALIIIVLCLLSIITIVVVASINANKPTIPVDQDPDPVIPDPVIPDPVIPDPVEVFLLPVTTYEIGMDFTDDGENLFVYNRTLNCHESHRAVDFLAEEGTSVLAMKSGTVIEVGSTYGMGAYIKIDHGGDVIATYASLKNISVTAGSQVKQGDKIGEISDSANYEFMDGPHLHLEMTFNGLKVNPWDYIDIDEEEE